MPRVQQTSRSPRALTRADHVEDAVELGAVLDLAPGGAHAEAGGAGVLGVAGGVEDGVEVHQGVGVDVGVVAGGLGAVGAVLGAAAGFDGEEDADLDLAGLVVAAVDLAGAGDQVEQGGW